MTEKFLIDPIFDWNPQRGDEKTPFIKLPDWAQCMGNSFQSIHNWCGLKYPDKYGSMAHLTTFAYYHGFEAWLLNGDFSQANIDKLKKEQQDYIHANHVKYFNILAEGSKLPVKAVMYEQANLKTIAEYVVKTRRPAVLGTKLSNDGHIIRIMGYVNRDNVESAIVSDPYGEHPYDTPERKVDGHLKEYTFKKLLETGVKEGVKIGITRMTLLEDR